MADTYQRTVAILIDPKITLVECMRMAHAIGATVRGRGNQLMITRKTRREDLRLKPPGGVVLHFTRPEDFDAS